MPQQLSAAASEVRRHDRDRFVASLFAPPEAREGLFAVYAFDLELARVRELVREPLAGLVRLQWWRDTLTGLAAGEPAGQGHPVAQALADAIRRHGLPQAALQALVTARQADLDPGPPGDIPALMDLLAARSAPLARLGLAVLGVDAPPLAAAAERASLAFALTGTLRAVGFHAATGRVLLPGDRLAAAGIAAETLLAGERPENLRAVTAELSQTATGLIAAARRAVERAAARRALPLLLHATIAERHLARLAEAGHDPFAPTVVTARPPVARLWWRHWRGRF